MLLSTKANVSTYVAGKSVVNPSDEQQRSRKINMVGDYAFENSTVKEVVFRGNVGYIGAMAFVTKTKRTADTSGNDVVSPDGTTIESVVLCDTVPDNFVLSPSYFELSSNYDAFTADQKIYVRKSQLDNFKSALSSHQDQVDYKIPGGDISNKYATFSREFDVDLNSYVYEEDQVVIAAFAGTVSDIIRGNGDYGETDYYISMNSVDEYTGMADDWGYMPANTGVLIKIMHRSNGTDSTPSDFWYSIGEEQQYTYDDEVAKKHFW